MSRPRVFSPAATATAAAASGDSGRPSLRLLPVEVAAAQIGIPRATMYRLIKSGDIAETRLFSGKRSRVYIRESELEAFLVRHTTTPASTPTAPALPTPWQLPPDHERKFS